MAWGNNWDTINKMSKEEIVEEASKMLGLPNVGELIYQGENDNLIFICDICANVFDPGITGFQALIDAARQDGWKITFHILKEGYAMMCPTCQS